MTTGDYVLVYPTDKVTLPELTRAALALAGPAYVSVVSGAGSQALRIPADRVADVYERAGLDADGSDRPTPDASEPASAKTASGPDGESPGPDAPTPRPGARPAKRPLATKKTTSSRSGAQKKEGDDQ